MRLSEDHRALLKRQFADDFGPDAELYLFGSRVRDEARGGDVDLLVRSPRPVPDRLMRALRAAARAERLLDGRSVDVLLLDPDSALEPIHAVALREGVRL